MSRGAPVVTFACRECGYGAAKRWDRCPECFAFGSFVEQAPKRAAVRVKDAAPRRVAASVPLSEVSITRYPRRSTGLSELDRVLGRGPNGEGLAPGQVLVLGGSPGVGKSTLLMQALVGLCGADGRALYASGEETQAPQVEERAPRALLDLLESTLRRSDATVREDREAGPSDREALDRTIIVDALRVVDSDPSLPPAAEVRIYLRPGRRYTRVFWAPRGSDGGSTLHFVEQATGRVFSAQSSTKVGAPTGPVVDVAREVDEPAGETRLFGAGGTAIRSDRLRSRAGGRVGSIFGRNHGVCAVTLRERACQSRSRRG